jgi:excisionase family DNA binding protein
MIQNHLKLLNVAVAAEALGLRPKTLRAWIAARRIGYVRIGGAIRIPEREVQRIIDQGTVPARKTHDNF